MFLKTIKKVRYFKLTYVTIVKHTKKQNEFI